jgi:hypothetical protein
MIVDANIFLSFLHLQRDNAWMEKYRQCSLPFYDCNHSFCASEDGNRQSIRDDKNPWSDRLKLFRCNVRKRIE